MQSVHSTAPANWATFLCDQFHNPLSQSCPKHIRYESTKIVIKPNLFEIISQKYSHKDIKIFVEKRKISYFGLALNLFQYLISPNQDDLSYSARIFISGLENGWAAKPTLFGLRRRPEQTFVWPSLLSDAF